MLDERKANILRAVVTEYIETAQPVGSSHVATSPEVNVSSATVRSAMASLETEGYLHQPHTSAGRVPTEKGYRFFVDQLGGPGRLGASDSQQVRTFFADWYRPANMVLAVAGDVEHQVVLDAVAKAIGWDQPTAKGVHRGIAVVVVAPGRAAEKSPPPI
jgi:heat shock gene repressor HrcA